MKRIRGRIKEMLLGASVGKVSCETKRSKPGHGRSTAIADKDSLLIFCTEREVESLMLQIEHPAKRNAYLSKWKASVKIANRKNRARREVYIFTGVFFIAAVILCKQIEQFLYHRPERAVKELF